jgi:NitT/TauT family transport system substrate-binding protein
MKPFGKLKAAVLAVSFAAVLGLSACVPENDSQKKASITVGMEATAVNSLIYIAESQNYFTANGIWIAIQDDNPSGAAATEQMLAGKADISTTAEFAIVRYAFERKAVRTLGSIDMFMHMKLIGRKDRGITKISNLSGKRIGVPLKTAADFKLGRFLELHGIDKRNITIVDVQAPQALDAMTTGAVDAIVAWEPNVTALKDRLGEDVVIWDVQSGQPMYCILVTTEKWAAEHFNLMKRFTKSLLQAEDYLIRNGDRARTIIQKRLGYDDRYITAIWPEHQFSLRLDQSLILAMEDQARWMIENRLTAEQSIPDFIEYICTKGLESVKPGSVNLIRAQENP